MFFCNKFHADCVSSGPEKLERTLLVFISPTPSAEKYITLLSEEENRKRVIQWMHSNELDSTHNLVLFIALSAFGTLYLCQFCENDSSISGWNFTEPKLLNAIESHFVFCIVFFKIKTNQKKFIDKHFFVKARWKTFWIEIEAPHAFRHPQTTTSSI